MQQSRLEKFFSKKNSSSTIDLIDPSTQPQSNKRSTSTDQTKNKKLKRTQSELSINESNDDLQNTFSLNQFYLDKFLLILSSLLEYHQHLFHDNELKLLHDFQNLSGRDFSSSIDSSLFSFVVSSQIIFVRLLMRHCKWLRRSTINYEIPDSSKEADHLTPLVQIGLVQDSKIIQ